MNGLSTEIEFGSPIYVESVQLRTEVLRTPLGLTFSKGDLMEEYNDHYLVTLDHNNALLACLVMSPIDQNKVKMRQVAVQKQFQGKGVGTTLVLFSERWSKEQGFDEIVLHAREIAVPFYTRLNYLIKGEMFKEVGIPHYFMHKRISS